MSKTAIVLAAAVLGLLPLQVPNVRVSRVIDGDTIEVELDDGRLDKVRYIGIDTPEVRDRRPLVRQLAAMATAANRELVEGRRVRLELDVQERDRYGRLLAYVWLDTLLVNEWLVREGYAAVATYPPNVKYVDRFVAAERAWHEERNVEAGGGR